MTNFFSIKSAMKHNERRGEKKRKSKIFFKSPKVMFRNRFSIYYIYIE